MTFKRYLAIINIYWQRGLTYRFTIVAYRIGEILEALVLILMWTRIYQGQETVQGFTLNEMITYVLVGNVANVIVRSFLRGRVAVDIHEGKLSAFLTKPISYFRFTVMSEFGRASLATGVSFLSQLTVIFFFTDKFVFNVQPVNLLILIPMLIMAYVTEMFINYLIGLIAFWTDEVDGLYETINRLKKFFAGGYFPLSLLPAGLAAASYYLPFAYAFAFPAQLFLNKIPMSLALRGLIVQAVWILLLYFIIRLVWRRGIKRYEATGI